MKCEMIGTLAICQPEKCLYEIRQRGVESTCYVMVPNTNVCDISNLSLIVKLLFYNIRRSYPNKIANYRIM